jgi:hypothetical protein
MAQICTDAMTGAFVVRLLVRDGIALEDQYDLHNASP